MSTANAAIETVAGTALDELSNRSLTFLIGDVVYGIELSHVIEIISIQPITPVPALPAYIKGIINLRGKVVPVIDVRLKFNQEERAYDEKTCIIVTMIHDMHVGLIVDRVAEVLDIAPVNSTPPPELGLNATDKYLTSIAKVGNRIIMNIDCQKFFMADLNY